MGQKVHPLGFRLGITQTWRSNWIATKEYAEWLHEDLLIRQIIKKRSAHAGISRIDIERTGSKIKAIVHTARPGIVIGRRGSEVDQLRADIENQIGRDLSIVVQEIKNPELDAQLLAENIALQLERRVSFRRVVKRAVTTAIRLGAKGVKVSCAGRLGGGEIARSEWYREGRVPLHTLRAIIDYGFAESNTTYGKIGVKTWVFQEEVVPTKEGESHALREV